MKKSVLSEEEVRYLKSRKVCRVATASTRGGCAPHVVPVIYLLDNDNNVIIAVDYNTKKLANLRQNPTVAIVVDEYSQDDASNSAVMIQGTCTIYERGREYLELLKLLFDRFSFYRENPWGEGESPILRITPTKSVSWGL